MQCAKGVVREPPRKLGLGSGVAVLVVAAALLLAACSSGGGSGAGSASGSSASSGAAATQTDSITISNFMFSPMTASVTPGEAVHVANHDSVAHTLSATGGQFDTGNVDPGQTKTFTAPMKPGTYDYICNIHQYMKGTIVVR
jgi:plastocyanin